MEQYFDTSSFDNETVFVRNFVKSLVDSIVPVFTDYQNGLILTRATLNALAPYGQGGRAQFNIIINNGTLIGAKPFKGIVDRFSTPEGFDHTTPYVTHLIKAIDLALMLTMMKWASKYTMNVTYFSTLKVGNWLTPPPGAPGPLISKIPKNDKLYLSKGSSSIDLATELSKNIKKFIMDVSKFPKKTEFMINFVDMFSEMFANAISTWMESAYFLNGVLVIIYAPPIGAPLSPPVCAALKVSDQ